jgi:tetratricopeptide (TPR) repeat protein
MPADAFPFAGANSETRHVMPLLTGLGLFIISILAADEPSGEDAAFLESAVRSAYRGEYRIARKDLEEVLEEWPRSTTALEALGRLELLCGRLDRALELAETWSAHAPENSTAVVFRARVLSSLGRYEEAETVLREALARDERSLSLSTALADLLFETGRRDEARALARGALNIDDGGDGDRLLEKARLHIVLGDLERAARAAVHADAAFNGRVGTNYRYERYEALLVLGELYRITRLDSGNRALRTFRDALKINPDLPGALLGRARTRLYGQNWGGANTDCDRALLLDPGHAGAIAFKAQLLIRSGRFSDALARIEKGLSRNPKAKELLAGKAACLLLMGDAAGSEKAIRAALAVDPVFGGAHLVIGEALLYNYRFSEARVHLEKSIELDPELGEGYVALGRTLANLGLEKEAEAVLRESIRRDPFEYPWRYNMLKILSELELHKRERVGEALYSLDIGEWRVMEHYLPELFERSVALFEEKYGISITGPIVMEMFPLSEDFAVRTIGFSGLGALGACFGDVITLLSPRAEGFRQAFNWTSTLHHELAHTFTLKLSRHRVPRWLSEGFSVFEEQALRPTWYRDMEFELFNAYHNDTLIRLREFNAAFAGPRVLFAYFQSGLFVKYVVETFGWEAALELLKAYGRDMTADEVMRTVLGMDAEATDAAFRDWIAVNVLDGIKMSPVYNERKRREFVAAVKRSPEDADLLARAAWACFSQQKLVDARYYLGRLVEVDPENASGLLLSGTLALSAGEKERAETFFRRGLEAGGESFVALRSLGILARDRGDAEEAAAFFERAIAAFPGFVGNSNPYQLLSDVLFEKGETDEAMELLRRYAGLVEHDFPLRIQLAGYYAGKGNHEEAAVLLREAVEIDPFVRSLHLSLAESLTELGRLEEALEELDVALLVTPRLEAGPVGEPEGEQRDYDALADIHAARAAVLLLMDRSDQARRELERALTYRPGHPRAEELMKKIEP